MLSLDVSKDQLACALLDPKTRALLWERTVPNTAQGVAALLTSTPAEVPWVMEPTGRYSLTVAKQATAAGRQVLLAPPQKAKAYLRSIQSRAKTDRLDARGIGLYALQTTLAPYPIKSEVVEQLQQLLTARRGLSGSLGRLKQQQRELPHAAGPLGAAIDALRTQLKELDRQIGAYQEQFSEIERLDAVDGVGPVTAAASAACLTSKQFRHPDAFVAYIGLDIAVRQSGKRQGERGLTKQGDPELRRLFYLCAQANLRSRNSPFRAQYERERAKGLPKTAALCAVARKLARVCWSLCKHGGTYDRERVYTQATKEKA